MDKFIEIDGLRYKLAREDRIKTDDPELPSFEMPSLANNKQTLEIVEDVFCGSGVWVNPFEIKDVSKCKTYLPQWTAEPSEEYCKRAKRTLFHNFFAPAVKSFPGFLSGIKDTSSLYQGIQENLENIDLQGNNLLAFLWQADLKVIRDGFCGILVDMPRLPRDEKGNKLIKTLADQSKIQSRPYLVLIDRRNILSLNSCYRNGKFEIERITIREYVTQAKGKYGSECITRYKTFYCDGSYEIQVIIEQGEEVGVMTLEEGQTDLKELPIVLYSATEANPIDATPPLENLALKNLAYYDLYSEYREIIHKLNSPVPVRTGLMMPGGTNARDLPPMVLGANTGIDVPTGGAFGFASPDGSVLATDRAELDALEISMHSDTLRFVAGGKSDRTATEVQLDASHIQATLTGMVNLKESAIEEVAAKWAGYHGKRDQGGRVEINKDLLDEPLTEGEINSLSNLAAKHQISTITLLELLKNGKRLPEGINPAKEIKRLAAQQTLQIKQQQQTMALQTKSDVTVQDKLQSEKPPIKEKSNNGFTNRSRKNQK